MKLVKVFPIGYVVLFFASSCALPERRFEATPASLFKAVSQGETREGLASYEVQAKQAEKDASSSAFPQQHWEAATTAYKYAARAAWESGDLQKSILYGQKALETAEKTKEPRHVLNAVLELIGAYRTVRDFSKSTEFLNKGFDVLKQIPPNSDVRANWEGILNDELGQEFVRKQEYLKAINAYLDAISWNQTWLSSLRPVSPAVYTARTNILLILGRLGTAYRGAGKLDEALEQYQKAFDSIKEWGLKYWGENSLYIGIGDTYLQQKNHSSALENFQKALVLAQSQRRPAAIRSASERIADILRQTGKAADAVPHYKQAIQQIESTRSLLESTDYRQSYFEGQLGAYVNMMNALLLANKFREAFDYTEKARSRVLLDVLGSKVQLSRLKGGLLEEERALQERIASVKVRLTDQETTNERDVLSGELADAEKAYNSFLAKVRKQDKEQASLMAVEPLSLKQVQELLDPGTTLLNYFVTSDNVRIWVVHKDRMNYVRVNIPKRLLTSWVKTFRDTIFSLKDKDKADEVSLALYQLLIDRVLPFVRGKELIIVPHDVLHYLPFHALLSSQGKYLIQDYPISYLSSASLLQFTKEKRRAQGEKMLALGNPNLGDPKMSLQFAEAEAEEIRRLYPQSTVLLNNEATEEKAKTLSPGYDIIHFASHAELNENDPLASAILLAKSDKEDGRLEVREIFGMDLKASLVVLSACETGLGKLSSGDELVGLTRAFIYAGTPSVVASLWNVEDSSTAQLMASFYKNLKTMTKVEALRQAQLQLIRGEVRSDLLARRGIGGVGKLGEVPTFKSPSQDSVSISTSHPYFWAPFILVGDGK